MTYKLGMIHNNKKNSIGSEIFKEKTHGFASNFVDGSQTSKSVKVFSLKSEFPTIWYVVAECNILTQRTEGRLSNSIKLL